MAFPTRRKISLIIMEAFNWLLIIILILQYIASLIWTVWKWHPFRHYMVAAPLNRKNRAHPHETCQSFFFLVDRFGICLPGGGGWKVINYFNCWLIWWYGYKCQEEHAELHIWIRFRRRRQTDVASSSVCMESLSNLVTHVCKGEGY